MRAVLKASIGALVVLVVITSGTSPAGASLATTDTVAVPHFVGMTVQEATQVAKSLSLKVKAADASKSKRTIVAKSGWTVTSQAKKAGSKAEAGQTIRLSALKTKELKPVAVPDVEGMSLSHARSLLKLSGLKSSAADASRADRDLEYPVQWTVVRQEPAAGTLAKSPEKVTLIVLHRDERPDDVLKMSANDVQDIEPHIPSLDYLGLTVAKARDLASSADTEIKFRDGEDERLDDSDVEDDWVVISQEDPPGAPSFGTVRVRVVPTSAPEADQIPEHHPASWDGVTKYFGFVTGFATEDAADHRVADVLIDGTPVPMVFIEPFDAVCEDDVDASVAVADRNKVLPIGTRVVATALTRGYWNEGGFIHPVAQLNPEDMAADSTNEQLVRIGSWIPDVPGVFDNQFDLTMTTSPTYFTNPAAMKKLTPVAQQHLMHIIDAGNSAAGLQAGAVGSCVATAIERARLEAEAEKEQKAVMDAWLIEYQRKVDSGYFRSSCRDGDGDGVCHER